jgi:hypothetical protein
MDCGITVEASDLIVFINERLVHDSNQIKELLQYNDKMKFDIIKNNNMTLSNVQTSLNKRSNFNY